jgi:hypothetical protein
MSSNPGVLWTSVFRDLGFLEWKNVFGNDSSLSSTKFLNTACLWTGWGNINNSYGTACSFGGSDSKFFTGGQWLIDSPPSIMAAGKYHVIFDYQEESTVGGVSFRDCWFAYGASSLNANGRSGELGVITVAGSNADVLIDGCWYDRSVAESVKFVGISSGSVRIRNIMRGAKGGSWSGLPQVSSAANSDDSVTEV